MAVANWRRDLGGWR